MFIHELADAKQLFSVVSSETNITPAIIEKDYWLMHCLWALKKQGFKFDLKGGTSLSKGYGIISRFSEDVDIKIYPPLELNLMAGKNHDKPSHVASRQQYFEWLVAEIDIPGIVSVERDQSFDDAKLRNAGIRLTYNSHFERVPGLKPGILLEVGFDVTTPNSKKTITSWAFEKVRSLSLDISNNQALEINCYLPEYTFVEKLQTISTKYRQQQKQQSLPTNFMRHYYDVYQLLNHQAVSDFIGTDKYLEHKQKRFRRADEKDLSRNEAFILSEQSTRALYKAEYNKTSALYFNGQPDFDDILVRISKFLHLL